VREGRLILLGVGALGLSCVMTQLVLMRELLCALTGNELVLGVVLGNWLLLMGAGAWLGGRSERQRDALAKFLVVQIVLAILPVALVLAVRVLRNPMFGRGTTVGLGAAVAASFVLLLPYCLAAGFLLALACSINAQGDQVQAGAGRVYLADSLGSLAGGALLSLFVVSGINSFALLAGVGLVNLVVVGWLAWGGMRWRVVGAAMVSGALLALIGFGLNTDALTTAVQHPGEQVLFRGNSPYGHLVVTQADGQLNFFQNGSPVVSTPNVAQVEESVHYAMAQRPEARQVLLVGGGVAGAAKELLKYRAEVTCLELDPLFLALGRQFLPENLADPRLRTLTADGRQVVQRSRALFDVIIIDLTDPMTAQLNRFYTAEFLAEAKQALTPNGVLALAVGCYENFVSPELGRVLATTYRTTQSAFKNTIMLPGGRVFFLASDGALGVDIAERLERAQIPASFVTRHYLDAMLTPDRLADLQRAVTQPAPLNRDFNPVLYFDCLRLWASQFHPRFGIVGGATVLALGIYLARLRGPVVTVFASGFTASSLEMVLLLAFQALCGSLYYQVAVIVTVFMAGLAVGAAWANRWSVSSAQPATGRSAGTQGLGVPEEHRSLGFLEHAFGLRGHGQVTPRAPALLVPEGQAETCRDGTSPPLTTKPAKVLAGLAISLATLGLLLPAGLNLLSRSVAFRGSALAVQIIIAWLTFVLAALVGAQFPVANRAAFQGKITSASRLYTADFLGASLGALLASTLLIPLIGVTGVCWLTAAFNALAAVALVWKRS